MEAKTTSATRNRIVRAAGELLRRRGYDGMGVNRVLDESGTPRGSLYFHFPGGKRQLAAEAIADQGELLARGMELSLDSTDDVADGVGRIIDFIGRDLERSGFERGCPIGAVSLDAAASSTELREACARVFESWTQLIAGRLRSAGLDPRDAADRATLVVAAIEGALMLARSRHDPEPLSVVARQLRSGVLGP